MLQLALREAATIIEAADRLTVSALDSLTILDLLENPPAPTARLRAAAWYRSYGAVPLRDTERTVVLLLATLAAALRDAGKVYGGGSAKHLVELHRDRRHGAQPPRLQAGRHHHGPSTG